MKRKPLLRQASLQFLSNIIHKQGTRPDERKIDAIRNILMPQNTPELKPVLDMAHGA